MGKKTEIINILSEALRRRGGTKSDLWRILTDVTLSDTIAAVIMAAETKDKPAGSTTQPFLIDLVDEDGCSVKLRLYERCEPGSGTFRFVRFVEGSEVEMSASEMVRRAKGRYSAYCGWEDAQQLSERQSEIPSGLQGFELVFAGAGVDVYPENPGVPSGFVCMRWSKQTSWQLFFKKNYGGHIWGADQLLVGRPS